MKFWEIFRFEFRYQVRRPWPWIFFGILIVLNFLMTRDATLSEALFEEFLVNSPFAIAKTTVFGNLLWLVMAAFITGDAAARDFETRMHPLVFTLPINKLQYLGGRFLAAFLLHALILTAVQLAIMLAIYSPGVDPQMIGPFSLTPYLSAYLYIGLPTAFAATAIQFAFATVSTKPIASYAGSVLLVFMGFFIASLLLFNKGLGTLLDPIGIRFVVQDMSHLWTTTEKNYRAITFDGIILQNRTFWTGLGLLFLSVAFFTFRFQHRELVSWKLVRKKLGTLPASYRELPASDREHFKFQISNFRSGFALTYELRFHLRQTWTIAWTSFKSLAFSLPGLALLAGIPMLTILVVIDQMEANSGQLVPTTFRVLRELTSPLSDELSRWVVVPAFIIFFAGELVWREREARMNEITDTIAGSDWAPLLGKWIGLVSIIAVFTAMQMLAGMLAQVALDYRDFEIGLYFKILFGLQLVEYTLFAMLVLTIHVVAGQKYFGHMIAVLVYVFIVLSSLFGIQHNMLVFGASPSWSYTNMQGFGNSIAPWVWFKSYWAAWTLLAAVIAKMFWMRGDPKGLRARLRSARLQFMGSARTMILVSLGLILTLGGFVFYNTNIKNSYLTERQRKTRQALFEQRYGIYKSIPQPQIKDATLHIEIYQADKSVEIEGTYVLVNADSVTIDFVHIATQAGIETELTFNRATELKIADESLYYSIYALKNPLQPGDSLSMNFRLKAHPRGFTESGTSNAIVENGTRFSNEWFPTIGYAASRELLQAADRRDHGLPPRPVIASLYDAEARNARSAGINLEVRIGTDNHQMAIAPGQLQKRWNDNDRNYFQYRTSKPIGNEWSFLSADYSLREEKWRSNDSTDREVTIRIFHVPSHSAHLDRMTESIKASLTYYSKNFGPYPYDHLTVAESPGEGTGLHADASMLTYSEGFSLWKAENNALGFDFPYAIVAHEIAHQWTVPYANVEGAPVMSESVAWYYGMKLVENAKGADHLRALLKNMRQPHPYPPIRRGEPLLRGLDPYLSYRRGPFALYTLSEYVGEEKVNFALRKLLENHRRPDAPLATTLDLYQELQRVTPDSLNYLLHDLFETNTYWQLAVRKPLVESVKPGLWQLTFEVDAQKVASDSAGVDTEVAMNDWIELGIYTQGDQPIYLQKHLIVSGKQKVSILVPQKPSQVRIDPNHLMIDLKPEDNVAEFQK